MSSQHSRRGSLLRPGAGGLLLAVRLTPESSRDAVERVIETAHGLALAARVRAIPEKGAANAALEALIATWLDLPRRDVEVSAGTTSRLKSVLLRGDTRELEQAVASAISAF